MNNKPDLVKVRMIVLDNYVVEGNCVIARWGGEQPNTKDQSVGNELDSADYCGELPRIR